MLVILYIKNSSIIKNYSVPLEIIPIYEMLSKMIMHIIVVFFLIVFFSLSGGIDYAPTLSHFNFIFYWLMLGFFITGLNYFLGALAFILKDITNLASSIMQGFFWLTPIIWEPVGNFIVYEKILNPYYYFIDGYRNTLLEHQLFIQEPLYNLYVLIQIFFLYYFGYRMYSRVIPSVYDNIG